MRKLLVVAALASSAGCLDFGTYGNDGTGGNWGSGVGGGGGGGGSGSGSGSGFGAYDMDCPGGSVCSPKTPRGLQFAGAVPIANGFPNAADHNHIAVDGTDDITLKMINADGSASDLAFQYVPLSANDNVLSIDAYSGPIVTLRGLSGTTNLHIIDPETLLMYDRYAYASSAIAQILPVSNRELITSTDWISGSASAYVFAPGAIDLGVALINNAFPPNRLVDTSLALTRTGATQAAWDTIHIPTAALGHFQVEVATSGGLSQMMDVEVANQGDTMTLLVGLDSFACFGASTHGAFISGLTWSFTVGGVAVAHDQFFGPNCVANPNGSGTFTVTASAAGKTLTITTAHPQQLVTRDQLIDQVTAARTKHAD